jgi:1A family penicillin-binding protein
MKKIKFGRFNPLNIRKILSPRKEKLSWKKVGRYALYVLIGFVFVVAVMFAWYSKDLPTPSKIASRAATQSTKIYDRTGQILLYETGEQKRTIVKSDQISDNLKKATIATEDANFYKHHGFDPKAIFAAVWSRVAHRSNSRGGASTVTQQYVKNALLDSNYSLTRKIKELILSIELEIMYDKDEILTMYLNEIPYGGNTAGAEAAAKMYYGIPAKDLTLAQAATLAAIPQAPTYYSPYGTHTQNLVYRKNYVLQRMVDNKYITQEEADAAKNEDTTTLGTIIKPRKDNMIAPHFAMYVIEQAVDEFGEEKIQKEGLKIITTLDFDKQKIAEESVTSGVAKINKYGASNAALTAVDPNTGQVLAMVGSIDYYNTEIDGNVNVADSSRQPGSSFKPFAYATAFKKKEYSPAKIIYDLKTDFGGGYTPQNYNGNFNGPVTMRTALASSLNIPAVKVMSLAGMDNVLRTAEDMGITTLTDKDRYGLSLVLGAGEVKPVEMAGAFGVFAAKGTKHDLKCILKVVNSQGKTIYEYKQEEDKGREVLDPQVAYEINSILSDNKARSMIFGTNNQLAFSGKTIAAKTGTTSNFKDAWTMGYSADIATAVWVGNNNSTEMSRGADGSVIAAPIFHAFMDKVVTEDKPFERPKEIQDVAVDKMSTKLPSEYSPETITDIFASWQVPTDRDDIHVRVKLCRANGLLAPDGMPDSLTEERLFTNIHSERPDYPNWEGPVRGWADAAGLGASVPTERCDANSVAGGPEVSITSPGNGSTVSGVNKVSASASAAYGVKNVTFSIDNVSIGTVTDSPYEISYNFSNLSNGSHELSAIVTDNNNGTAKSNISVTVNKDSDGPIISGVSSSEVNSTTYTIVWTTNEASTSQVSFGTTSISTSPYNYPSNSTLDGNLVTSHTTNITVAAGSTVYYRVRSKDSTGNITTSNEYSFSAS